MAAAASGCGGGGDSGTGELTQLAFTVSWEQRLGAASVSAPSPEGAAAFATPIPPSVNAIRFIFRPDDGGACCISVIRGSSEFEERRIQLADVPVGPSTLEVNGFPTGFAPSGGVAATCPTRPAATTKPSCPIAATAAISKSAAFS